VFDADCVLCSRLVHFVLCRERDSRIVFVNAWCRRGNEIASEHGLTPEDLQRTFLWTDGTRALLRSDAAIEVARHLRAPWHMLAALKYVPRPIRDAAYALVARWRYRIFGRRQRCFVPPAAVRERFVDDPPPTTLPNS
jgi:predicted DCC family thiol-disulfide oxidoreductase YuxK